MGAKKSRSFLAITFKTKEDFDKHVKSIYDDGRKDGYRDGLVAAISYFLDAMDMIEGAFDDHIINDAAYQQRNRNIRKWQKKQKIYEDIKKSAVDEYIESQKQA